MGIVTGGGMSLPRQGAVAVVQKEGGWDGVEERGREFQKSFGSGIRNTGNRQGVGT